MDIEDERLIYKEESYVIQGAVFDVYKHMGCGFLEAVYQECLVKEFTERKIPFVAQRELNIAYKGQMLQQTYRPDFICFEKIILELKAVKSISSEHRAQIFNYLRASGLRLGMIINFGHYPNAQIERVVV